MASGTLADDIRLKLGTLSPAERKVARVLLAAYPAAGFETVATIAERAAVSAPTVLRFAARLGYSGFPEFQAALRAELDQRNASPLSLYEDAEDTSGDDSAAGLMARSSKLFTTAVAQTLAETPPHDLERAVALLSDPKRRITLVGGRFTHLLAQYLGLHLMQLRDDVHVLPERDVERAAALARLGRRDVLVVFDYRRYEESTRRLTAAAKARRASVVLFTDAWLSPIASEADVVLPSETGSPSAFDAMTPVLALVEAVIAECSERLGDAASARMREVERAGHELDLY